MRYPYSSWFDLTSTSYQWRFLHPHFLGDRRGSLSTGSAHTRRPPRRNESKMAILGYWYVVVVQYRSIGVTRRAAVVAAASDYAIVAGGCGFSAAGSAASDWTPLVVRPSPAPPIVSLSSSSGESYGHHRLPLFIGTYMRTLSWWYDQGQTTLGPANGPLSLCRMTFFQTRDSVHSRFLSSRFVLLGRFVGKEESDNIQSC
jgi:hypothetical protein